MKLQDFAFEYIKFRFFCNIIIKEKFTIFLYIVSKKTNINNTIELFDHSKSTIYNCFYQILKAILILYQYIVKLPDTSFNTIIPGYK